MSFNTLNLCPPILQAVRNAGYTTPTPIQSAAIPRVLSGRDLIGIAQTGTGKTAAFVLPMLELLGRGRQAILPVGTGKSAYPPGTGKSACPPPRGPRALVVAPTRELAAQVAENFDK